MPDLDTAPPVTRNGAEASVLTSPLTTPLGQTSGEGLDRRKAKRRFTPRRIGMGIGALALIRRRLPDSSQPWPFGPWLALGFFIGWLHRAYGPGLYPAF